MESVVCLKEKAERFCMLAAQGDRGRRGKNGSPGTPGPRGAAGPHVRTYKQINDLIWLNIHGAVQIDEFII